MSIETLASGSSQSGSESFAFVVDYDTVNEDIGLTCTGTGHANLSVIETSNSENLGGLNADQYGTTSGPLTDGASASPVTYTGDRVVVLGTGASGVDSTGATLPTVDIPSTVVGAFDVPKGEVPGLGITLQWGPNADGALDAKDDATSAPSLAATARRCHDKRRRR